MSEHSAARQSVIILEDDEVHGRALVAAVAQVPRLKMGLWTFSRRELERTLADGLREPPGLVLLDVHLPDGSSLDLIPAIQQRWPDTRILVISALSDERTVVEAIRMGAQGFLHKEHLPAGSIASTLEQVLDGNCPLSPGVARHIVAQLRPSREPGVTPELTPRERDILDAMSQGLSYDEAAQHLGVSLSTIQTHIRNLYRKLDATSKVQALNAARRYRLIS